MILYLAIYNKDFELLSSADKFDKLFFFKRQYRKECITFIIKVLIKNIADGAFETIKDEGIDYLCHIFSHSNLIGVAVTDMEYPQTTVYQMFLNLFPKFVSDRNILNKYFNQYQDYQEVDKIAKIQNNLNETKIEIIKTVDKILERGEKLEILMEKTQEISLGAKEFYKKSKKLNNCCWII